MKILMIAFFYFFQAFFVIQKSPECNGPIATNIIYQSKDGGRTWQDISAGLPLNINPRSIYSGDGKIILSHEKGIFRSNANASTPNWEQEAFLNRNISNLFKCNIGLFAHSFEEGFFQEIMGSGIWVPAFTKMNCNHLRCIVDAPDGSLLMSSNKGIFKSTDNGINWKLVYEDNSVSEIVLGDGVLLGANAKGLIRSTDAGETWEQSFTDDRSTRRVKYLKEKFVSISNWGGTFKEVIANPGIYSNRLRISEDKGITWHRIDENLTPIRFALTADESRKQAPTINDVVQLGDKLFCSMDNGIFSSNDLGKTWKMVLPNTSKNLFELAVSGKVIYAVLVFSGC